MGRLTMISPQSHYSNSKNNIELSSPFNRSISTSIVSSTFIALVARRFSILRAFQVGKLCMDYLVDSTSSINIQINSRLVALSIYKLSCTACHALVGEKKKKKKPNMFRKISGQPPLHAIQAACFISLLGTCMFLPFA